MSVRSNVETITPKKAQAWLLHRAPNRPICEFHLRRLASSMKAGVWKLNGEAIKFNDKGDLEDGQHRLEAIVLSGELGGTDEEQAAAFIKKHVRKPVISFIAGKYAPRNKKMGHAGAIISGGKGTFDSKIDALRDAGVLLAELPDRIPALVKDALSRPRNRE